MIVQPDFLDHWKTKLLVNLTGPSAISGVLRFWFHCQTRRQWKFKDFTPEILAAVCHWDGDPQKWWDAMTKTFIDLEGKIVVAHQWNVVNASLLSAWERGQYGKKGGRPKITSKVTSKVSPTNLGLTLDKPDQSRSEKSRVDQSRSEPTGTDAGGMVVSEPKDTKSGNGGRRLHGIPATPEEVIVYGKTLSPVVTEDRCRGFFAYYEGQAKISENGDLFWVTKSDSIITNWKIKLPEFSNQNYGTNPQNRKPTVSQLRNATIIGAETAGTDAAATVARRAKRDAEERATKATAGRLASEVAGHGGPPP